jgi:hypothetical protein
MPAASTLLILTEGGGWEPGLGDPTIFGWVSVFGYFAAAYACLRARRDVLVRRSDAPRLALAWLALGAGLVVLGVNKQLDLQSLVTVVGRRFAMRDGWYEERRLYQLWFIRGSVIAAAAGTVTVIWWLRAHIRELWLAAVGGGFLAAFVIVRAASFHHVDALLQDDVLGVPVNALLEIGGIALVGLAAAHAPRDATR